MSQHEFENHLLMAHISQTNVWLGGAIDQYTLRSEIQMERPVCLKGTQSAQLRYLRGIGSVGCCEVYDGGGRTYHCGVVKLMAAGDPKLQVHQDPPSQPPTRHCYTRSSNSSPHPPFHLPAHIRVTVPFLVCASRYFHRARGVFPKARCSLALQYAPITTPPCHSTRAPAIMDNSSRRGV